MPSQFISHPIDKLSGDITVPGDKSISHRSIILGAIANGTTTVDGFLDGEDCLATLEAFRAMGVDIEGPIEKRLIIHGVGKQGLRASTQPLNMGNSGTSMRLLTGLLSAQSFDSALVGDESLTKRPMERVSRPLNSMGANVVTQDGKPPLMIKGGHQLNGIDYEMPIASAQVKSCLLLAGLYADGETTITEPGMTRDHTERMLTSFSYPIKKSGNTVAINGGGELEAADIIVPGDISSAAFFMVAACIVPGADIVIRNIGVNPTRVGVINILQAMGADIKTINKRLCGDEPVADIWIKYQPLEGITIPLEWVPLAIDEFPAIFIAAACANGRTILHGAKELRMKESDRILAMTNGLQALGIDAEALDDGAIINGGKIQGGEVESLGDHRIAMAFSIAGSIASSSVTINDCDNVATSFPNFIEVTNQVGMQVVENAL